MPFRLRAARTSRAEDTISGGTTERKDRSVPAQVAHDTTTAGFGPKSDLSGNAELREGIAMSGCGANPKMTSECD